MPEKVEEKMESAVKQTGREFLRKRQVCERAGISPRTLDAWREKGCPTVKIGGCCLFDWESVQSWMMQFSQSREACDK